MAVLLQVNEISISYLFLETSLLLDNGPRIPGNFPAFCCLPSLKLIIINEFFSISSSMIFFHVFTVKLPLALVNVNALLTTYSWAICFEPM